MPKGKKKKQHRPQVPALSWGDKAIYNVLAALCLPVSLGVFFLWRILQVRLLTEQDALAVSEMQVGGFVLFMYVFCHLGVFLELKQRKVHLFGRRDITYGPPKWQEVYPIFRRHPKVSRKPEERRRLRRNWLGYLAIWAAVVIITCGTMFPRAVWENDGSVTVYDWRNQVVQVHEVDDLVQVCFETDSTKAGRHRREAVLQIRLTTADGKVYIFDQSDQSLLESERKEWLAQLVQLKESLPVGVAANMVNLDYDVDAVIQDNDYSQEEAELLCRLFGE